MSYTYPEAITALESIANDFIKALRPQYNATVRLICDATATTASVRWDAYGININMPVRPATSLMTQTEFEDWTAYLLHELGHPTHTEQSTWFKAVASGHSRLLNALEDVRMEQALIASGIVRNACAVLSRLVSRKVAEARAGNWKPNARKEIGWTICVLGRANNGYVLDAADIAWIKSRIKPGSTVGTVLVWALPELAACASTADCLALAERIAKALAVPATEQKQGTAGEGTAGEGTAGEGTAGEGTADEETAGEGQGEGEGEGEGQDTGEGDKPASDAPKASETPSSDNGASGGNAGKGGKGHGDGSTDDEAPVLSNSDLVERDLAPQGENMAGKGGCFAEKAVLDILRDNVIQSQPRNETGPRETNKRLGVRATYLRDAAAQASRQRALLARALRANETDEREGGRKAGRLDKSALSRAMAGSPNVFARREISEGFDTDVCVLLDASGSMSGENMRAALETGLVIAQAASSVGASCTTEVFNSRGYVRAGALASKRVPNPADYSALLHAAGGGTPLSAHMARIAVNQAKRAPHKRRVLFVVTDGGCDYGPVTVKRMAAYLEQACGTVMAHVSIGTALQGAFKAEVMVPCGTPVAKVGLDHFVKILQAL
jgi:Mg-chelatase subunit ChlD